MADFFDAETTWYDRHPRTREATRNGATHVNAAPRNEYEPVSPPTWMGDGACGGDNAHKFERAIEFASKHALAEAKAVCVTCPVVEQCLQFELEREGTTSLSMRYGVFGATTPAERYALSMNGASA